MTKNDSGGKFGDGEINFSLLIKSNLDIKGRINPGDEVGDGGIKVNNLWHLIKETLQTSLLSWS